MADAGKSETAKREEKILEFWEREHIFEKSLAKKSPKGEFVFYEGPPTANGKPGIHHLEARAFKDAILRRVECVQDLVEAWQKRNEPKA